MKQLIVFLALMLISCATEPVRQFNVEDESGQCFMIYGYSPGYCGGQL